MSIENGNSLPPAEQPVAEHDLWDIQRRLVQEYLHLREIEASKEELSAKANQVNQNVRNLLDAGEIEPDSAWALGAAGDNPFIDEY